MLGSCEHGDVTQESWKCVESKFLRDYLLLEPVPRTCASEQQHASPSLGCKQQLQCNHDWPGSERCATTPGNLSRRANRSLQRVSHPSWSREGSARGCPSLIPLIWNWQLLFKALGKRLYTNLGLVKWSITLTILCKGKADPLHAMEALVGRGSIAPTHFWLRHYMGVSGQRHAPAALYPRGKDTCTGGWVGLRAGLDTEVRGKILSPRRGSNPDRPVVQSVARH
jgi:hypothetical protein